MTIVSVNLCTDTDGYVKIIILVLTTDWYFVYQFTTLKRRGIWAAFSTVFRYIIMQLYVLLSQSVHTVEVIQVRGLSRVEIENDSSFVLRPLTLLSLLCWLCCTRRHIQQLLVQSISDVQRSLSITKKTTIIYYTYRLCFTIFTLFFGAPFN